MKLNRRRGATLGLVAVCVFVIIILGVGFFILSKIIGGGREVANATDAGVLTVARMALSPTAVSVNYNSLSGLAATEFIGLDPTVSGIGNTGGTVNMQTLNRVFGQAVLVALNAQQIDTPLAAQHANEVATAARAVSTEIRNLLYNTSTMDSHFIGVAHSNNTKMWQGSPVDLTGSIQSAFMRPGYSTNVYFHGSTNLPVSPPANVYNNQSGARDKNGDPYMAGYVNFSIPCGNGAQVQIAGVPIFPQTQPHLVDIGEFDASTTDPIAGAYLPPNAFRANSQAIEGNAGSIGGTAACAIVGALDSDFAISMPRGYVRIINGEDANVQNTPITNPVINGQNDIFNNELWPPSKLMVSELGSNTVYTTNNSVLSDFAAYNADTTGTATVPTYSGGVYEVLSSAPYFREITDPQELITVAKGGTGPGIVNSPLDCDAFNIWEPDHTRCNADPNGLNPGSMPHSASAAFGRSSATDPNPPATGYTNIEYMKASLLNQRANGAKCATVNPPAQPSGMKKFHTDGCYNTPTNAVNFGQIGSPMDYLDQIGDNNSNACANNILQFIADRMSQVDYTIDVNKVRGALASQPLQMGSTLALYSPGPGSLVLTTVNAGSYFQGNPASATGVNDGANSTQVVPCENTYRIDTTIINSNKGAGGSVQCPIGDANYHESPFVDDAPITAVDRCMWTPASGWRNLLGDIKFENTAQNGGQFCKPN